MLDNLIESKNTKRENLTLGKYLLTTLTLVLTLALSGVLWSLFAKDAGIGGENMELSTLVAPVSMPETKPPPVEKPKPQDASQETEIKATRQINMSRVDEPHIVPVTISAAPNPYKARPQGEFKLSTVDREPTNPGSTLNVGGRGTNNGGEGISSKPTLTDEKEKDAPPSIKKPAETVKKITTISEGVINGKAINLPKPPFPQAAIAVRTGGNVDVQVTIDEKGNVISAKAVNGHPLLRAVAERAAWQAKFSPTYLSKEAVKVTGVIVYKFSN